MEIVNDCLDDIRNIILDDNLLEISILDTLEIYNFREFIVTNLNGENVCTFFYPSPSSSLPLPSLVQLLAENWRY